MSASDSVAIQIVKALSAELLGHWDGKDAIAYLKSHNYHWRQMEWIGWYFELRAKQILHKQLGGKNGPEFGNVEFDIEVSGEPWDFKSHPVKPKDGWMYLNDVEAVDTCVISLGSIGWIVAMGVAVYDVDGSFKAWHDEQKGKESAYEADRKRRGAPSRKRKCAFNCTHFLVVKANSKAALDAAVRAGIMTNKMQEGQRNAGGGARRPKYGLHAAKATQAEGSIHLSIFRYPER